MSAERCETTELPADQCACRLHRGGLTVEEEASKARRILLARPGWFVAVYPGSCDACGERFEPGSALLPAGEGRYRAECCAEVPGA